MSISISDMETIFETEHLIVRKFRVEDAKRLYEYHLDENVKQWMPNESYEDIAEAEEAIDFSPIVSRKSSCRMCWPSRLN